MVLVFCRTTGRSSKLLSSRPGAAKKIVSDNWQSGPSMFGLIIRWAQHKPSFNFAADVMNFNFFVSRKIAVSSPYDLCRLCGWILTQSCKSNPGKFNLEDKQFHACLEETGFLPGHHALELKGVISALYQKFETTVLPSFPKLTPSAVTLPEETPATEERDHPVMEGKRRKGVKSVILSVAKKRKYVPASPQFELLYVHDPSSFYTRLTQNTKCLQIALF